MRSSHLGQFAGLLILAIAPLAVAAGLLVVRHLALRDLARAESWVATPCAIEKCEFVTGDSDDARRTLELAYRYEFAGSEYRGERLDLLIGSFDDDDTWEETIFESFPPGATATCYVDPSDPTNSVFDRDNAAKAPRRLVLLAFPFLFVGCMFTFIVLRAFIQVRKARGRESPTPPHPDATATGRQKAAARDAARQAPQESAARGIEAPGPPPRRVSWPAAATVLAGPVGSQVAWPFLVGFLYVFIILDGPASYARLFKPRADKATATGRITDARELPQAELHVPVWQFTFEFQVGDMDHSGLSFTRGQRYKEGDAVAVAFNPAAPADASIAGTRSSSLTWWHSLIPLGVVALLGLGLLGMIRHHLRVLWLLRYGQVTSAARQRAPAGEPPKASEYASMLSDYRFGVDGRSYRAKTYAPTAGKRHANAPGGAATRHDAAPDRGGGAPRHGPAPGPVTVLYYPRKPAHNVILDRELMELAYGQHSRGARLVDCAAAPLCIFAIVVLWRMGAA